MALVRPRSRVLTARIGVRYRTAFRVGINLGDAVVDDKDLYGDGSRLPRALIRPARRCRSADRRSVETLGPRTGPPDLCRDQGHRIRPPRHGRTPRPGTGRESFSGSLDKIPS